MRWRWMAAALLLGGSAMPQDMGTLSSHKAPVQRVTTMTPPVVNIAPGGKATTELAFQVKHGFHINSNKPGSNLLLPTVVKLSPPTNIGVGGLEYPPGREQSFPFSPNEKLSVYTGDFTVTARVGATKNMPPGRFRVHGFLEYQACDDRACYPPTKLPISFDVRVSRASATTTHRRRNPPQSPHVHN